MLKNKTMAFNFSTLLGASNTTKDFRHLLNGGAHIIDVRSVSEFDQAHLEGALNWPMMDLLNEAKEMGEHATFILCCASGVRAGKAKSILKNAGFENVFNAGSWMSLERKLYGDLVYKRK